MNKESGQVTVFAALMLIVFVSVAAFCMNAAYAFHQHTQMQAQVDTTTLYASTSDCSGTVNGVVLHTPPVSGPYTANEGYCEGIYTKQIGSLFGKILRFPSQVSVHAVALHGGSTAITFALLGLSTHGVNGKPTCSVYFSGDTKAVVGLTYSDAIGGSISTCEGGNSAPIIGPYVSALPIQPDPFAIGVPTTGLAATTGNSCSINLPTGSWTTYQPQSNSNGVAVVPSSLADSSAFLPYCDSSGEHPGIYLITGNFNPTNVYTYHSVFILESSGSIGNGGSIVSGESWDLHSPIDGVFTGYALYQETACNNSSQTSLKLNGNSGSILTVAGLFDMSCADLTFSGSAQITFNGPVVENTIDSSGNSVLIQPVASGDIPHRGSFLVQ